MTSLLSIQHLNADFQTDEGQVTALNDISLEIAPGEIVGLVGESGSGKSVTAKSLMRLNSANIRYGDHSRILFRDQEDVVDILSLRTDRALRKVRGDLISMIFQEPMASFAPALTIGDQMCEQLIRHRQMNRKEAKQVSLDALKRVGISDETRRFDQYAFELSGGMRQRAMIAMALSTRPKLLIADEPTTALDVTIQAQILRLIRELVDETGMGVLFITHDLGVIAQTADRVAVMYLGEIIETGSVRQVIKSPAHPYTKGLLAALPKLDDLSAPLTPVPGDIPGPLERPTGCVFQTRCQQSDGQKCVTERPILLQAEVENHLTACFYQGHSVKGGTACQI